MGIVNITVIREDVPNQADLVEKNLSAFSKSAQGEGNK
jgi:hypothetical protein